MEEASRIEEILGEWLDHRDAGERVDPEEVIAAHPEFEEELRRRFRVLSLMVDAVGERAGRPTLRSLPTDRYGEFSVAGEGGMGIVYWALDTDLNRQVAFKIVKPGSDGGETPSVPMELSPPGQDTPASQAFETLKARFLQEAWVTAGLEHPGIVPVYELGETAEGVPYYTMRFVRGKLTLAAAIEEAGDSFEERLALLEPFLKVCDTIRYAHAHGVIHRDLKPENVAIGEFGEVVVLDWGLAKLRGQEDRAVEVWQERLEEYREATDLRTVAGALGTPGYMSLEAALGEVDQVDERSDVYSLGAMLYQLLTGKLPHAFTSYAQMVGVMLEETPAPAHEVDPQIPEQLSVICASALACEKEARFASAGDLAEALRRWQRESAVEREVRELLTKAEAAFEGTEGLAGEALLKQLDRVTAACSRIREKAPDHAGAESLVSEAEQLRSKAIAEAARAARGKLLKRVAAVGVLVVVLAAAGVIWLVEGERRETAAALERARIMGLVNASAAVQTDSPQLSLLLAREAATMAALPETEARLRGAISGSNERTCLRGHAGGVWGVWFSPAGDRVLTASGDGTSRLWDLAGNELAVLSLGIFDRDPSGNIFARIRAGVVFSPDGRWLVAFCEQPAQVLDRDGKIRLELEGAVRCAAFSPASELLVIGTGNTARILDLSGTELAVLRGHERDVTSVAFSPSGGEVLTRGGEGARGYEQSARLWSIEGEELAKFSPVSHAMFARGEGRIVTVGKNGRQLWSNEGELLLTAPPPTVPVPRVRGANRGNRVTDPILAMSGDLLVSATEYEISLWDLKENEATLLHTGEDGVRAVAISPDGRYVVGGGEGDQARIWDRRGREVARLLGHGGYLFAVAFDPSGERVLTAAHDGTARLWDLHGRELARFIGHDQAVLAAAYSPDGRRVATASLDRTARLWDPEGSELSTVRPGRGMTFVAFSPGGDRFLTVTASGISLPAPDNLLQVWDLDGRRQACVTLDEKDTQMVSACFTPEGDQVLVAVGSSTSQESCSARILDLDGKEIQVYRGHENSVLSAVFSTSGDRVLTGSVDQTARLWDREGRELAVLDAKVGLDQVAFSPSGERILGLNGLRSRSMLSAVLVWNAAGEELAALQLHEEGAFLSSARFLSGGDRILVGVASDFHQERNGARIWDLEHNELVRFEGHGSVVMSVDYHPATKRVLTASNDRTLRMWDLEGNCLQVLRGHRAGVLQAVFSPDGRRVLSADISGTVRLWVVGSEDLLALANERALRELTTSERRAYADLLGLDRDQLAAESVSKPAEDVAAEKDRAAQVLDFLRGLEVDDPARRREAAAGLAALYPEAARAVPVLLEMLEDDDEGVRQEASRTLSALGPAGVRDLTVCLDEPDDPAWLCYHRTFSTIIRLGASVTPKDIAACLTENRDSEVRRGGLLLGTVLLDSYVPPGFRALWLDVLVDELDDPDPATRAIASASLVALGWDQARENPGVPHPDLVRLLEAPQPSVRFAAARMMEISSGASEVYDPFLNAHPRLMLKMMRGRALPPVSKMIDYLKSADKDGQRRYAADQLRMIGSDAVAAVPLLEGVLDVESSDARIEAARALWVIAPPSERGLNVLIEALREQDLFVRHRALAAFMDVGPGGGPAVPELRRLLALDVGQDHEKGRKVAGEIFRLGAAFEGWETRRTLLRILGRIGPAAADALPEIEGLREHEDNRTRYLSGLAIRRIRSR